MYQFKKEYCYPIEHSFLAKQRGFAFWLYRYYDNIKKASEDDEIDIQKFRNGILDFVTRKAASLPGLDRFICDAYAYKTKAQLLERCEYAIENARALRIRT